MNLADIEAHAVSVEEYSLGEIQYWLQYGKHTWSFGAGIIWLPAWIVTLVLKVLLIVFTPYMLWHLFKAKWYKSVVVLLVIVVAPFIASQIISVENNLLNIAFIYLPFLTFYFYTYIISYMIGEELNRKQTLREWKLESRTKR